MGDISTNIDRHRTVSRFQQLGMLVALVSLGASAIVSGTATAAGAPPAPAPAPAPVVEPVPVPEGLKGIPVPTPANLSQFVYDRAAAVRMGKALFWDMQLGSDGKTACASCHFQAGADPRSRNQIAPGLLRVNSALAPNPDTSFQVGGPNYQLKMGDFPFHKFQNPDDKNSPVQRTHNDVASSFGIFSSKFASVTPGASADSFTLAGDLVFKKDNLQTRGVEPRNSPTMINAVFNFRNFWDGRAQYLFNGVTPFGALDSNARVYKNTGFPATVTPQQVRIDNASIASLATGPALSDLEMSAAGRTWPHIGKRLLTARPLALQDVSTTDSVLAARRNTAGKGLTGDYLNMVKAAFQPEWWNGTQMVTLGGTQYTQAEANFSLFFGLAIREYAATLVSDDSPFDRHMAGDGTAMSTEAKLGLAVFFGKARCAECHGGAEFTNASVRQVLKAPMTRMVMGNGGTAVYDEGFYNISVGKTLEDLANGATNGVGRPTSLTALAQQVGPTEFQRLIGIPANVNVLPTERIAVKGAFKTPTIRNAELTAPYFHNGDSRTLEQVVEFYNRGGNHFANNLADVDAEIKPLGLSVDEMRQLVSFIRATTDERVRYERAPFDHPQLIVPNGHSTAAGVLVNDGGKAQDDVLVIPAVGAGGRGAPPVNFLEGKYFAIRAQHSGKCLDVAGGAAGNGVKVQQLTCSENDNQLWQELPVAQGFLLRNKATGDCLDVSGISQAAGATIYKWQCTGGANQTFNWNGGRLVAKHSGQCVNVSGASTAEGGAIIQYPCTTTAANDSFTKANGGYFQLAAKHSQKCVDVIASNPANGAKVGQVLCRSDANDAQLWKALPVAGGFALQNKATGKCLDVAGISLASGAAIYSWQCTGGANQIFNWKGDQLQAKHSGMCLNVPGASRAEEVGYTQFACVDGAKNESFYMP